MKEEDRFLQNSNTPSRPWDVKRIFKLIVMSATYRQAAITTPEKRQKDPQNRLRDIGDARMEIEEALATPERAVSMPPASPHQSRLRMAAYAMVCLLAGAAVVSIFGFNVNLSSSVETVSSHLRDYLLGQFGNAVSIGLTALTTLLQILLMFVVAFLLALDAHSVRRVLRRLVPNDYRSDFDQIWRRVRRMLYGYVRGQIIVAGMIGILSGIGCAALGLPDAVALGLIAGITAIIPYLGPFIGALPAVLVGLASGGPFKALLVVGLYFLISNVILNFVYPKVMGDAVRLPPLLVIVALIAGFSWAGILGMFVAVPLAATLRIVFDHIYPRLYEQKPA